MKREKKRENLRGEEGRKSVKCEVFYEFLRKIMGKYQEKYGEFVRERNKKEEGRKIKRKIKECGKQVTAKEGHTEGSQVSFSFSF